MQRKDDTDYDFESQIYESSQLIDYFYLTEKVIKREDNKRKVMKQKETRQMSNLLEVNSHGALEANISLEHTWLGGSDQV